MAREFVMSEDVLVSAYTRGFKEAKYEDGHDMKNIAVTVQDWFRADEHLNEIIRCKDCIYYSVVDEVFMHGSNEPVQLIMGCAKSRRDERVKPDDFCCWGRARDHG